MKDKVKIISVVLIVIVAGVFAGARIFEPINSYDLLQPEQVAILKSYDKEIDSMKTVNNKLRSKVVAKAEKLELTYIEYLEAQEMAKEALEVKKIEIVQPPAEKHTQNTNVQHSYKSVKSYNYESQK